MTAFLLMFLTLCIFGLTHRRSGKQPTDRTFTWGNAS